MCVDAHQQDQQLASNRNMPPLATKASFMKSVKDECGGQMGQSDHNLTEYRVFIFIFVVLTTLSNSNISYHAYYKNSFPRGDQCVSVNFSTE